MVVSLEARYLGYHDGDGYWVNVRNANPTGKIGDGGVIRRFETKEDAKAYASEVNATGVDIFSRPSQLNNDTPVRHMGDEFVSSRKTNNAQNNNEVPEISWFRASTGFLTEEQVDKINETRKLPDNVKIVSNGFGGYNLTYNYMGIRPGTQTVPEGFELKQDITGFVHILPKDTNGLFYK